jgi:hypothetical protein
MYSLFIINSQSIGLNDIFTSKEIARLKNGEIITRMYIKNNAVKENTDLKIEVPKAKFIHEDFSPYEMITDEKAFIPYKLDEKSKLSFYNTIQSFSKLKGMTYYSRRIQKVETLILDCYRIESISNKKRTNDVMYNSILPKITNYFIQKDNRFGSLTFKSELYNEGDNFILINTCMDKLSKLIFNISNKEEYKFITYFIYDKQAGGYYYYSVNLLRIRDESFLKKGSKLTLYPTTFSNRLRGATVRVAKLLGLNWDDKINPWDEEKLNKGFYKNY